MDKRILENYRANKRLIERNTKCIEELDCTDIPVIKGTVKGSSHEFPYIEQRFTVEMNDPVESHRLVDRRRRYQEEIRRAEAEIETAEQFINSIDNPVTREVFHLYFIEGEEKVSQKSVAMVVHCERSNISKIISRYI